jgi:phosphoglycolate phosphatase
VTDIPSSSGHGPVGGRTVGGRTVGDRTVAVGFDLDMTLIDSRPGIAAAYRALTAATGVPIDADLAVTRLGPPLRTELGEWFPAEQVEAAVTTYRALYPDHAVTPSLPLPGAVAALAAVRAAGYRVVVVTSKLDRLARVHLDHLGMLVDEVIGDLFAEGKAAAIVEHGVALYVGDHVADMVAATTAGVPGVGVTTGPCTAEELWAAGATTVLDDLTGFPAVLHRLAGSTA